jgi:hypothetical protein
VHALQAVQLACRQSRSHGAITGPEQRGAETLLRRPPDDGHAVHVGELALDHARRDECSELVTADSQRHGRAAAEDAERTGTESRQLPGRPFRDH